MKEWKRCLLTTLFGAVSLLLAETSQPVTSAAAQQAVPTPRPNVLFIAIDDLNDWIGVLGKRPDVKTPNIDRLAARGVLFTRAYSAAPACNPSRTAMLTGVRPSTSGVYHNNQPWRPALKDAVTLPQYFWGTATPCKAGARSSTTPSTTWLPGRSGSGRKAVPNRRRSRSTASPIRPTSIGGPWMRPMRNGRLQGGVLGCGVPPQQARQAVLPRRRPD